MKNIIWNFVSVILTAITVWGKPACRIRFRTEVVCVAGKEDYILQRGLVSDNNNTIAITLKDCRITDVDFEAFKNVYNLEEIDLSRNKITYLEPGVLDGIPKLMSLRLSRNLMTTLPLGLFDDMPNLQRLYLSDNIINYIELGVFDSLANLQALDLSGNVFLGKDLDKTLLNQNTKIKYLHFSRNDISGAPDNLLNAMQELLILGLNNCSLTEVPKFGTGGNMKTLKQLHLQTNKIKNLDNPEIFANLENLVSLDLMGNSIGNLNESVFKPLSKLKSIYLSFNKIKQIPVNLFHGMISLENIDLAYNLIEIIPVNVFSGTRLSALDLSGNRISYLDRNFFSELGCCCNKRLKIFYFKDNPFQCACLMEILNEVKKYGIKYDYTSKEEQALCSTTNELTCIKPADVINNVRVSEDDKLWSTVGRSSYLESDDGLDSN